MKHLFFLLILFLSLHLPTWASNAIGGDYSSDGSELVLIAPLGILPSGGFFPVRIEMENKAGSARSWKLSFTSNSYSGYYRRGRNSEGDKIVSHFSVTCPASAKRTVELLVPIHHRVDDGYTERRVEIEISNGSGDDSWEYFQNETPMDYHFAMSENLLNKFESEMQMEFYRTSRRSPRSVENLAGAIFDVKKLPTDWRAYSGYDAIVLSRQDYLNLESGAKTGIEKWVSAGGHLMVLNDSEALVLPGINKERVSQGLGSKTLIPCGIGYGDFETSKLRENLVLGGEPQRTQSATNYSTRLWGVGTELGTRTLGTGLLLVALSIFAIVVGPVNLFVWANRKRRHRLFITTPIISLIASLLLVAFILVKDGFGGDGARAVAIEVGGSDDSSSVVLQEQFTRTGIVLDSDFSISDEVVFTPVRAPSTDFNRSGTQTSLGVFSGEIQRTEDGWDIEGNFFKSRSEQAQVLKAVRPSREGLELISAAQETPQVVSSFSYALTDVFFRDGDGEIWAADSIEPGATVTLTRSARANLESQIIPTLSRFGKANQKKLTALTKRLGSFCALAPKAPGLETLGFIDWVETPALITGLLIK